MEALPLVDGALFVSSSFLSTLACPRESYYYKIRAKVLASKGAGLQFGTHLHSALALHYRLQEFKLSPSEIKSRVTTMLEGEFEKHPTPEGNFRTLNWAVTIYEQYCRKFSEDSFDLLKWKEPRACKQCKGRGWLTFVDSAEQAGVNRCIWCNGTGSQSLMVEVPFVVKLFDASVPVFKDEPWNRTTIYEPLPVYYHGIIDLPILRGNLVHVLDFKSAISLGDGYWDDKKMLPQLKGYSWALAEILQKPVHGYFVRALRTKEPPQWLVEGKPSKKGEIRKIEDWWDESLGEQRFDLGQGEIEEWKRDNIAQVETFLWHYYRGFFPQNKNQCVQKYRCQYFDCCSTFPPEDREMILSSEMFVNKTDNLQLKKETTE